MRILFVCRSELYSRLIQPFIDESEVDRTVALMTWEQVINALHSGADGIVIEEGISFASTVKSLPYAKLVYAGNLDYKEQAHQWLEQLRFNKERTANVSPTIVIGPGDEEIESEVDVTVSDDLEDVNQDEMGTALQSAFREGIERVEKPRKAIKEVNLSAAISHLTDRVKQVSLSVPSFKRKDEGTGKLLVVGGGGRVGKTWIVSTILGLLGERCKTVAVDRDGSLSALWRLDDSLGLQAVYGRSVVAKADYDHQIEDLLQTFDLVIIEVTDVLEWLEAGVHAMFVVDNDPFHFYEAVQSPWNQMDWEGRLTVVLNRSPHLLSRKYTDQFLRHSCFQVPNQGVPMELVYRDVEPILSTSPSFRNSVFDLNRKLVNRSGTNIKKM